MIAKTPWIPIIEQAPPYDTLVLVKGTKKISGVYVDGLTKKEVSYCEYLPMYAIAFNECYPPLFNMTQVVECEPDKDISYAYPPISFDITYWMEIPA